MNGPSVTSVPSLAVAAAGSGIAESIGGDSAGSFAQLLLAQGLPVEMLSSETLVPASPEADATVSPLDLALSPTASAEPATRTGPAPATASTESVPNTALDAVIAAWLANPRPLPPHEPTGDAREPGAPRLGDAEPSPSSVRLAASPFAAQQVADPPATATTDIAAAVTSAHTHASSSTARTQPSAAALTPDPLAPAQSAHAMAFEGFRETERHDAAPVAATPGDAINAAARLPGTPAHVQPIAEAKAPLLLQLPAAPHNVDFAPTLALTLSHLARDGVQEARLALRPAEMGPIDVRIALDGVQAHVEFRADVAATRSAIEAGLPELAGALREAGFTLAGGGVFQQRRRNAEQPSRESAAASDQGADPTAAAVPARRIVLGRVDLYA